MAHAVWLGHAAAVAQVTTYTLTGAWATNDTATFTINGKSIVATVTTPQTIPGILDAIIAAWNDSEIPEFAEITATEDGVDKLTLTADVAGVPFTVSGTETTAGSGAVGSPTAAVAATGPNHWDDVDNWSTGTVPVDSDTVSLIDSDVDILYGLDQASVALTALNVYMSYTGNVGLPRTNALEYNEYRDQYLKIGATAINYGLGEGAGGGRFKINCGTDQATLNVFNTGSPEEDGVETLLFLGSHANNAINVNKGSVGVAVFPAETATVETLRVGYTTNVGGDSIVRCGVGVTHTTVSQSGGTLETNAALTTCTMTDGELTHKAGALGTLTIEGGVTYYQSTGTLTTVHVGNAAILDFRRDMRPVTVTNCILYNGFEIHDPTKRVTFTNGIDFYHCAPSSGVLDIGSHQTLTSSAV